MKNSMTISMTHSGFEKKVGRPLSWYRNLLLEFKEKQTGYAAIAIIGQSCLGSAGVMLTLMNEIPMFLKMSLVFLITILCMGFNAAVLAQLKPKTTFNLLCISILFSFIVILINLF